MYINRDKIDTKITFSVKKVNYFLDCLGSFAYYLGLLAVVPAFLLSITYLTYIELKK